MAKVVGVRAPPAGPANFESFAWVWSVMLASLLTAVGWIGRSLVRWKSKVDNTLADVMHLLRDHDHDIHQLMVDRDRFHPRRVWPPDEQ